MLKIYEKWPPFLNDVRRIVDRMEELIDCLDQTYYLRYHYPKCHGY